MNLFPLDLPWNVPTADLNEHLRLAGIEPVRRDGVSSARDLDLPTRESLVSVLRDCVCRARADAPPVEQWAAASQSLFMNYDFSEAARQRQDAFWLNLTRIVNGCYAQVVLGDLSEFPFFVELLKYQPAGHLIEMSTSVLCHYVDLSGALDAPQLIQRAEEWYRTGQVSKT